MAGFSAEDLFGGINFEDLFGGLNFDFGGGFFDRFFRRRPYGPPRGEDVEINLTVPLEKVASGGGERIHYSTLRQCSGCKGSGAKPGTSPRPCSACKGTGVKVTSTREANVLVQYSAECTNCGGRGTIIDQPCSTCSGRGEIVQEEALEIAIPPGVEEGMVLRVVGRGRPAPQPGGVAGDLYARIVSAPDLRFARSGCDLWREESIPVFDAVLGTSLLVPTLRRPATVHVPPGTQPGTVLRLKGQGLPEFRGSGKGDLLVRIVVKGPERPSEEEKELFERLRIIAAGSSVAS